LKMVRELEAEGLVTYGGRKSLRLAEAGRRRVQELNPRGVLLADRPCTGEAFRETEKLEHRVSPEVVRRIAEHKQTLKKMRGF
jgi:Mn-dependent DtxR family transcriptional regulator